MLTFSSGSGNAISFVDVDINGGAMRVSLAGASGTLTLSTLTGLSFIIGDGTADTSMTFTGTLAAINAALNGMTFTPGADFNGPAEARRREHRHPPGYANHENCF